VKRILSTICVLALVVTVPCISDNASAAGNEHIWLYEIIPAGSFEAVTVYNAGAVSVNMKGYYLDDGEGTVRFSNDLFIGAKQFATFASKTPNEWFTDRTVYVFGTHGIVARSFILADAGDEVMLRKVSSGEVLDTFVYGNGNTDTTGWKGEAFGRIPAGKMAVRVSPFDTDTKNDWRISVAGRTDEKISSAGPFDAVVTPFVFPDSRGDPLFTRLENAVSEVLISIYLIDHREIISLLMLLVEKGVSVKILAEGSPVGGVPDVEIRYLTALYEKGADVRIMKSNDGYKRYDLVHSKYAVVDSDTVIVTSENWREGSFNSNRGWGAIIESDDNADYMRNIFFSDFDPSRYDTFDLKEIYQSATPISVPQYKARTSTEYESFQASVKPILSPDFSFEYLKREMLSATERIYAEQMTFQYAWTDPSVQSPLSWSLTASGSGADVKILLDTTFDNENDSMSNYAVVSLIRDMGDIQAKTISGGDNFNLMHNKGVIIDDTVWVSSVNWSNAAFMNNRELAVSIDSRDVADYFAEFFLSDWGPDAEMDLIVRVHGNKAGEPVILDASFSSFPHGTVFEWDLDGDMIADRTGIKIAVVLPEGVNECTLFARDASGSVHILEFTVVIDPSAETSFFESYVKYAPILIIMLTMLAVAVLRKMRGKG